MRSRRTGWVVAALVGACALAAAVTGADLSPATTASAQARARDDALAGSPLDGDGAWPCVGRGRASVVRLSVPAPSNRDAGVVVVRPPGKQTASTPVVYLLHGYPDSPLSPLEAGLACSVLGKAHRWPPFVLAVPDGARWRAGDHEWADAADGADQIETWLTSAVVPAVEGGDPRSPARRTLAGFSMGAYGALNVGLHHQGEFRSLIGVSGYYRVDDPEGVFGGDPALMAHNTPLDARVDRDLDPPLRVALAQGDDEEDLIDGQGEQMAARLRRQGIPVVAREESGEHDWGFVADRWPSLMTWAARSWRLSPAASPGPASPGSP